MSLTRIFKTRSTAARFVGVLLLSLLAISATVWGQLPVPGSSQFDITGFIQSATLGGAGSGSGSGAHQGGFITVNGHLITIPSETIVILPANALTWQELFAQAPAPYGPGQTGLAMADVPPPLTTYEAHVIGNRVLGGPGGADVYIAGLVWITQQGLNSGQGFINCINYATGEMRVGGPIGNCAAGMRIQLNDPLNPAVGTGRYGRPTTPDARFTVDQDNPTIQSITGFPMCIPRVLADPNIAGNPQDPLCPVLQRPLVGNPAAACAAPTTVGVPCTSFTMLAPPVAPGGQLDPTVQAPFEVGDFVTYAGTLVQDATPLTPTAGPFPGLANLYISAHTITNNVAIYTAGGTNPAYITVNVSLIGTGGLTVIGANEAAIRTRFEGFTSDVDPTPANQRLINIYGIDLAPLGSPVPGATSDRYLGVIGVDPGPPTGAAKGRWRFRPPCDPFGTIEAKPDKQCVMNQANTFLPPTREVRAVIGASQGGGVPAAFTAPITAASPTAANGIVWGQYHAPIADYIFPEQLPGKAPIPENNFNTMPFLAQGGYTSSAGTIVAQLDPWPSDVIPNITCFPPTASAGGPYAVGSGGTIGLIGSSGGTGPFTFSWTATAGTFDNAAVANPNYTAPQVSVATPETVSLTASNGCGSNTASANVAVAAAAAPTVDPIANQAVDSGASGSFAVSGSDPNVPASVPLTWSVSQTGTIALLNLTITSTGSTTANVTYSAPAGVLVATPVTVTVTATNVAGVASAPVSTTVTINPAIVCNPPVANAGGPYTVGSGSSITLNGSASGTTPITFLWAAPSQGSINPLTSATTTYTAPVLLVATDVPLSLTASNSCGSNTAASSVHVNAVLPPAMNTVPNMTVFSGAAGSFPISGSDPNVPALLPLGFTVTQAGAPALIGLTVTPGPNPPGTGATVSFTAPTLPLGQVTSVVITLTFTATNSFGVPSAPITATVTVNPLPDVIGIAAAEYRTGLKRLIITATSTVVSPNVVLKLQPYLTTTGTTYNPDPAAGGVGNVFTNNGGGNYSLTINGVPAPACGNPAGYQTPCPTKPIDVKSNLNGDSGFQALTRIRQ